MRAMIRSRQPIAASLEKYVAQSAIIIATHQVVPFDMAVIDTCDGQRLFSFLSVEWAIIADVDCESEKYRFLGKESNLIVFRSITVRTVQVGLDLPWKQSNESFVSSSVIQH
jgi:hypothetical protein